MNIATIRSAARKMLIDFEETRGIEHNPTKGRAREYLVVESFLRPYLPGRYSVGSGLIIDLLGEESRQQDLMIYDAWSSPLLRDFESEKIIFPESLFAAIEVKSSMAKRDLHDMARKSASVASMTTALPEAITITPGLTVTPSRVPPLCAGLAFSSSIVVSDLPLTMREIRNDDASASALALVCVLSDKEGKAGLLVHVEEARLERVTTTPNAASRPAHIPCESAGDALLFFYLALMSHLAASGPIVSGPNLLAYAQAAGVGWPKHHVAPEELQGGSAEIEGRTISMDRIGRLRQLLVERQQGTLSDEGILEFYSLVPEAPGAEVLRDPNAIFAEDGRPLDLPTPRTFLDAVVRHQEGRAAPGDALLVSQLLAFIKGLQGRNIIIVNPSTGRNFGLRS